MVVSPVSFTFYLIQLNSLIKSNLTSPALDCILYAGVFTFQLHSKKETQLLLKDPVSVVILSAAFPHFSHAAAEGGRDNCISESLVNVTVLGLWLAVSQGTIQRVQAASFPLHTYQAFVVPSPIFLHVLLPCDFLCIHTAGSTCTLWWIIKWIAKCPCLWHLCLLRRAFDVRDPISIRTPPKPRWQRWEFGWQVMGLKTTMSSCSCDKCVARFDKTKMNNTFCIL